MAVAIDTRLHRLDIDEMRTKLKRGCAEAGMDTGREITIAEQASGSDLGCGCDEISQENLHSSKWELDHQSLGGFRNSGNRTRGEAYPT